MSCKLYALRQCNSKQNTFQHTFSGFLPSTTKYCLLSYNCAVFTAYSTLRIVSDSPLPKIPSIQNFSKRQEVIRIATAEETILFVTFLPEIKASLPFYLKCFRNIALVWTKASPASIAQLAPPAVALFLSATLILSTTFWEINYFTVLAMPDNIILLQNSSIRPAIRKHCWAQNYNHSTDSSIWAIKSRGFNTLKLLLAISLQVIMAKILVKPHFSIPNKFLCCSNLIKVLLAGTDITVLRTVAGFKNIDESTT